MSRNEHTEFLLGREISIRFVSVAEAVALHGNSMVRPLRTNLCSGRRIIQNSIKKRVLGWTSDCRDFGDGKVPEPEAD